MNKNEQNRVVAWRLKLLRQASLVAPLTKVRELGGSQVDTGRRHVLLKVSDR